MNLPPRSIYPTSVWNSLNSSLFKSRALLIGSSKYGAPNTHPLIPPHSRTLPVGKRSKTPLPSQVSPVSAQNDFVASSNSPDTVLRIVRTGPRHPAPPSLTRSFCRLRRLARLTAAAVRFNARELSYQELLCTQSGRESPNVIKSGRSFASESLWVSARAVWIPASIVKKFIELHCPMRQLLPLSGFFNGLSQVLSFW